MVDMHLDGGAPVAVVALARLPVSYYGSVSGCSFVDFGPRCSCNLHYYFGHAASPEIAPPLDALNYDVGIVAHKVGMSMRHYEIDLLESPGCYTVDHSMAAALILSNN